MTRNGICSACFLRRRRHCGKPVRPLRHGLCCAKFPFQGELGTKCQKGNWRHDVLNEGAPTDAANGCSPLIRLLPTVAATCSPSGTSCHLPRSGGVFPQRGKASMETASGMIEGSILALSVIACAVPPCSPFWLRHLPPTGGSRSRGEALAVRQSPWFCQGLPLWGSCHRR